LLKQSAKPKSLLKYLLTVYRTTPYRSRLLSN